MSVDQSNLECQICFNNYDNQQHQPKILPCGHVFCRACLNTLRYGSGYLDAVKCILCNDEHKLPNPKGLDSLPTDRFRLEVLDNMRCMDCGQLSPKTKKCDHCPSRACKPCRQHHHTVEHCVVLNQLRDMEKQTPNTFTTQCQQKLREIGDVDTDELQDEIRRITKEAHKVLNIQRDGLLAKVKRTNEMREKLKDALRMREFVQQTRSKCHDGDSLDELKSQCDSKQAIIADVSGDFDRVREHIHLDESHLLDNIGQFGIKSTTEVKCEYKFLCFALFYLVYQSFTEHTLNFIEAKYKVNHDPRNEILFTCFAVWLSYWLARWLAGEDLYRKAPDGDEKARRRFMPSDRMNKFGLGLCVYWIFQGICEETIHGLDTWFVTYCILWFWLYKMVRCLLNYLN